jgi:YidC/Oxa1 family membrane protein insertase
MDIPRYALIAASAVLGLMLLVEWTAFKERQSPVTEPTRMTQSIGAPSVDTAAINDIDNGALPDQSEVASDLPTIEQATAVTPAATAPASNRLVTIATDTLSVAIDLNGGDVIEAALNKFPNAIDTPNDPFVLLEQNTTRTYVAQSGLLGSGDLGFDRPERARYTTESNHFTANEEPLEVRLRWADSGKNGISIDKVFRFEPGSYLIDVRYEITNNGNARWQAVPFAQLKRDNTPPPGADSSGFGMQPFLGAALTQPDERFTKFSFGDIEDEPFRGDLPGGWVAIIQHYFLSAWVPPESQTHRYSTRRSDTGYYIAGLTSPAIGVDPGRTTSFQVQLYVGPKDQYRLAEISPHLDLTVDYGWLWWLAQPLFWLLTKIQSLVGNWGVAIILLTVLVKAAFFQLSAASYRSMAKMRKVQPKMQAIREEYASDKQKQSQAMMELYKKEKINPMGGCLPILIQMPVFISLYWVLMESVELRQAPFALWIEDLAVMDPYFVLPVLMGASMFFMQKLNPPPPDPMQAKLMQWLPIVFTFFFLWFPAGLVLYWLVNNLLSMAQQYVITRRIERDGKTT